MKNRMYETLPWIDRACILNCALMCALMCALICVTPGCGPGAGSGAGGSGAAGRNASGNNGILPRPFTAEQIRDEWVEGLTLVMAHTSADGISMERWTVVGADADGAEIEYTELDAEGNPAGEPEVRRSSWVELRDHASFPADRSRRREATVETALGELEGWLYLVEDPESGTVNEMFFATSLPGAPVYMRMIRGEATLSRMDMVERSRPE